MQVCEETEKGGCWEKHYNYIFLTLLLVPDLKYLQVNVVQWAPELPDVYLGLTPITTITAPSSFLLIINTRKPQNYIFAYVRVG